MARESIGSAIRAMASAVADSDGMINDLNAKVRANLGYSARSQLLHGGETDIDVVALLGPLEELLARSVAAALTTGM